MKVKDNSTGKFREIFVAFLENLNFTLKPQKHNYLLSLTDTYLLFMTWHWSIDFSHFFAIGDKRFIGVLSKPEWYKTTLLKCHSIYVSTFLFA